MVPYTYEHKGFAPLVARIASVETLHATSPVRGLAASPPDPEQGRSTLRPYRNGFAAQKRDIEFGFIRMGNDTCFPKRVVLFPKRQEVKIQRGKMIKNQIKTAKLFFPGRFEDAYIYNKRLLILTEQRTLRIYNLKDIVRWMEHMYPDLAPILSLMFVNNNWMQSDIYHSFTRNTEFREWMLKILDKFPETLEINLEHFAVKEQEIPLQDTVLLDFLAYNHRLYIGGSSGFYHFDMQWHNNLATIQSKPTKRIEGYCLSIEAGFGSVLASCHKDGLFVALDEFGWMKQQKNGVNALTKKASRSLKTIWTGLNMVNYSTHENPTFFINQYEHIERRRGFEREQRVLTNVGNQQYEIGPIFDKLYDMYSIEHPEVQYSYNTNNTFFVRTYDGHLYSLQVRLSQSGEPIPYNYAKTQGTDHGRILSTHPLAEGMVIETDDHIYYTHTIDGEWHLLADNEAMTLRTFPRSEPYQNILAIAQEDEILLMSVFHIDQHEELETNGRIDRTIREHSQQTIAT